MSCCDQNEELCLGLKKQSGCEITIHKCTPCNWKAVVFGVKTAAWFLQPPCTFIRVSLGKTPETCIDLPPLIFTLSHTYNLDSLSSSLQSQTPIDSFSNKTLWARLQFTPVNSPFLHLPGKIYVCLARHCCLRCGGEFQPARMGWLFFLTFAVHFPWSFIFT